MKSLRMYNGCTRDVQGLHKGTTRSQYQSNAGATRSHRAYVALKPRAANGIPTRPSAPSISTHAPFLRFDQATWV